MLTKWIAVMGCVAGVSLLAGCAPGAPGSDIAATVAEALDTGAGDEAAGAGVGDATEADAITETQVLGAVDNTTGTDFRIILRQGDAPGTVTIVDSIVNLGPMWTEFIPADPHIPVGPPPPHAPLPGDPGWTGPWDRDSSVPVLPGGWVPRRDRQDGHVWYSLPTAGGPAVGTATQMRLAIKTVPDPDGARHMVTFYLRATRPGTDPEDIQVRGAAPLVSLAPGSGRIIVRVQNMGMTYGDPAPSILPGRPLHQYSLVNVEPPALFTPANLAPNLQPMLMYMRAGDMIWNATGRFIHLVYGQENVVDPASQLRDDGEFDWWPVWGTNQPTAQVRGFDAITNSPAPYRFTNDGPGAKSGFRLRIQEAAFDPLGADPNACLLYQDASLPIGVAPNPATDLANNPIVAQDVFELAVCTIVVCTQ